MDIIRTQVRIPVELAEWLKGQAKANRRSMNGELIEKLEQAKKQAAA
jgi:RNAse (barnase) inhibitor barstar